MNFILSLDRSSEPVFREAQIQMAANIHLLQSKAFWYNKLFAIILQSDTKLTFINTKYILGKIKLY